MHRARGHRSRRGYAVTHNRTPPDNAPSLRDLFSFRFYYGWENPAEYTSFPPPSYTPEGYILYDLQITTVWNETEPHDRRTTIGETLRYARNDTMQNASTTDMTLLDVTWSKYGYNPYAKDQIVNSEPKPVDINGYAGLIYETESDRLIAWTAGNATYQVRGSLDRDELIRVAQSIAC
ncbi:MULTISPECIES: DUF4367 domain-containing protein [unclassified Methanoculleus]|uniref:DUF4367 domain-containing protein n=1 Tax=unclassified Methanoculleus TaxID=2619537 RepID=UPI0025E9B549|nr:MULTISPECIES: DUF4367 domain-containing protein [unclassified Methanoculleus]